MSQRRIVFLIGLGLVATLMLFIAPMASAGGPSDIPNPALVENNVCLGCHSSKELSMKLPSGEVLSLYTDEAAFNASVHGKQGQRCTACHTNITGYPHPQALARDIRDFSIQMYAICQQCHTKEYKDNIDSMHSKEIGRGDRDAAICTDCHTAHYVTPPDTPRAKIAQTCRKCHNLIYDQYKSSVHGAALLDQSNPDVPTCIDCHGVHGAISDPRTEQFRLKSPDICAKCHTNKAMMKKYDISTNVMNTYVADFHGTTVELFVKQSPNQPSNKPVCYNCHGVHDIRSTQDPKSSVIKENLLKTCQQCHPDATGDFPTSWMSHFDASPTQYPAMYYVNLFYTIFIPVIIGGMLGFVVLDAGRRILNRFKKSGSD